MPYPGFHKDRDGDMRQDIPKKKRVVVDTAGNTENFFTNHVRLITFLICIAIFLALFGPWSVFRIMEWIEQRQEQEVLITQAQLQSIVAKGNALRWSDFDGYTYKVLFEDSMYMCRYDVAGGDSYLMVTAAVRGGALESVLLVNTETGEQTELLTFEE